MRRLQIQGRDPQRDSGQPQGPRGSRAGYETFPGWKCDISKIRKYEDLPENAKKYLTRMAEVTGIGLGIVSVGPNRDETIVIAKDIF